MSYATRDRPSLFRRVRRLADVGARAGGHVPPAADTQAQARTIWYSRAFDDQGIFIDASAVSRPICDQLVKKVRTNATFGLPRSLYEGERNGCAPPTKGPRRGQVWKEVAWRHRGRGDRGRLEHGAR